MKPGGKKKSGILILVANKGRERKKENQLLCYFFISQAQHEVKKHFLIQLYIIFHCITGLDYSRREESKIKASVFPGASKVFNSISILRALYMDTQRMFCVLVLPEAQVNLESCKLEFLKLYSLRQYIY